MNCVNMNETAGHLGVSILYKWSKGDWDGHFDRTNRYRKRNMVEFSIVPQELAKKKILEDKKLNMFSVHLIFC